MFVLALGDQMVIGPPGCRHCELCKLWLRDQQQYDDHLQGKKHKKNKLAYEGMSKKATSELRLMGICIAHKWWLEEKYRSSQSMNRVALMLARKVCGQRHSMAVAVAPPLATGLLAEREDMCCSPRLCLSMSQQAPSSSGGCGSAT